MPGPDNTTKKRFEIYSKLDDPNNQLMSGDNRPNTNADDIDLIALLERCLLFFQKNKWIFLVAGLLGLIAGYLNYLSLPVVYKSRMIIQSNALSNQNNIQIATNWNSLLNRYGYAALAETFNIPEASLKKVKKIKAEEIQKIFTPNNPNGFTLDVWVTDVSVLDELQKGIVHGFDNSDYIKDRLLAKKERLQELIDKTNAELKRLDSTKKIMENILSGKGAASSSFIIDGSTISRQLIELNEKLLNFKEELRFTGAVQVLQGFSKPKNPAGPRLFVRLFIGLFAGLLIGYIIALLRSVNQKLKARANLQTKNTAVTS